MECLVKLVETREDVLALYLFGSQARGTARPDSDVDVALLLAPGADAFNLRLELAADFEEALGKAVDVIVMGDDLDLTFRVLREGKRLFERDRDQVRYREARLASLYYDYQPVIQAHLKATAEHYRG